MCPLTFNPDDAGDGDGGFQHKPGRYRFKVDESAATTFKTGSSGIKLKLLVDEIGARYEATCYENCVNKPKSLWRLKSLCKSVGVPFASPFDEHSLLNKCGVADFGVKDDGYLEVKAFLPPDAEGVPPPSNREPDREPGSDDEPPPIGDDDVAF